MLRKRLSFKKINLKIVCTDGNFSYEEELGMNDEIKHVISKSENWFGITLLPRSIASKNQVLQQIYTNARALNCFAPT